MERGDGEGGKGVETRGRMERRGEEGGMEREGKG